jgi:hypothetical protein
MKRVIQAKMKRKEEEKRKHVFGRYENTFSSFKKRVLEPLENAFSFPARRPVHSRTKRTAFCLKTPMLLHQNEQRFLWLTPTRSTHNLFAYIPVRQGITLPCDVWITWSPP